MLASPGLNEPRPPARGWAPVWGWGVLGTVFTIPVVCRALALEAAGQEERSTVLVLCALAITAIGLTILTAVWRRVVTRMGNAGLATIASIAGLQFAVSYAARIVGSVTGAILGPMYVFIDGIGSKGLSCLFLGVLVTILPQPGALTLSLLTLFALNVLTSGQVGLVAIVFLAVSIALHEGLAAVCGVTVSRGATLFSQTGRWSFALRAGMAIGLANALALYTQYALYEVLLRLYFDTWYKLSVSIVTGLIYGGVGAGIGTWIGDRLRRTAP